MSFWRHRASNAETVSHSSSGEVVVTPQKWHSGAPGLFSFWLSILPVHTVGTLRLPKRL